MSDEAEEVLRQVREAWGGDTTMFADAWVAIHEIYLSARAGGFTEQQTLYIIAMGMFGKPDNEA